MKENRHGRISLLLARHRKRIEILHPSAAQDRASAALIKDASNATNWALCRSVSGPPPGMTSPFES